MFKWATGKCCSCDELDKWKERAASSDRRCLSAFDFMSDARDECRKLYLENEELKKKIKQLEEAKQ